MQMGARRFIASSFAVASGVLVALVSPSQADAGDPGKGRVSGVVREINVHNPSSESDARIDFHVAADGAVQYVRMGPGCGPVRWELLPILRALKAEGTSTTFEGKQLSARTICLEFLRL